MIDLHSHILPIDDGAKSIEEAIDMIVCAEKNGYSIICCTSHYKVGIFENEKYEEVFRELEKEIRKRQIGIKILRGNELYLTPEGMTRLEVGEVNTIGETDYILVEAIPEMIYLSLVNSLKKVKNLGYRPILAHVERYPYLGLEQLLKLKKLGVIIQVNIRSLGRRPEIYEWIKLGLVDILATDTHDRVRRNYTMMERMDEIRKKLGEQKFNKIIFENPDKIIDNKVIWENIDEEKILGLINSTDSRFKKFFKRIISRRNTKNS